MHNFKKYAAILILLLLFPMARFIVNAFMLESSPEIYAFIPQESDLVIEVNTRNFVSEMAYQRIFEEEYFMRQVYGDEEEGREERFVETGLNPLDKVILFREQWANETVWFSLLKYSDEGQVKAFVKERIPEAHFVFSGKYAIIQLTPCSDQDKMDIHLEKIKNKEVKKFTERVNLATLFSPKKEINCFIIPKNTDHNQLIEGYLSFDFLKDHIAIEGEFTPIPGFSKTTSTAYALNTEKAFSLRSSLNIFNSIYWFNEEKIENIPEYRQMAFDYNGVDCYLIHKNAGFSTPFKSYPKVNLRFDIVNSTGWNSFFDSLKTNSKIHVDTLENTMITQEGAHFNYSLTDRIFELKQDTVMLSPAPKASNVYFELRLNTDAMIDNTDFMVDAENPPSSLEQSVGMMVANKMLDEIRLLAKMEWIDFHLQGGEDEQILANGRIEMKTKDGHAMVESLSFGTAALLFLKNY